MKILQEDLEAINNELYKVANLAKTLRIALVCGDYTDFTLETVEIESTLELIREIANQQTQKIMEFI